MDEYITTIEGVIRSCFALTDYRLHIERRTPDMAFIHGQIDFFDKSSLDFKEFVEKTDKGIEKYKYGYNYRKGSTVIFRYDNAPDPKASHLNSFPHHKHTGEGAVEESHFVNLSEVLDEIQDRISENWIV